MMVLRPNFQSLLEYSQSEHLKVHTLIQDIFNESLVALPHHLTIEKQLLLQNEHEIRDEIHAHWLKIKEKHTELGALYSSDKGERRSLSIRPISHKGLFK